MLYFAYLYDCKTLKYCLKKMQLMYMYNDSYYTGLDFIYTSTVFLGYKKKKK